MRVLTNNKKKLIIKFYFLAPGRYCCDLRWQTIEIIHPSSSNRKYIPLTVNPTLDGSVEGGVGLVHLSLQGGHQLLESSLLGLKGTGSPNIQI